LALPPLVGGKMKGEAATPLPPPKASSHAVRVGLAYVSSVGKDDAEALEAERVANGPFRDVGDLARRAQVSCEALEALVRGGDCEGLQPRPPELLSVLCPET